MKSILWILNGCGLEGRGITGGPVRFHEVSERFSAFGFGQHLLTTPGGKEMQTALGCSLPMTVVPASLFLKREPCRPFRLWSYAVTSLLWRFKAWRLAEFDAIVTVSDYFCDIVPALSIRKRTGAKWIAWIHHCETDPKRRPGNRLVNELMFRLQRWSFRRIAARADAAWINDTSAGDEIERRLLDFGMPRTRIRRMKNGIDLSAVRSAAASGSTASDAVMIGVRPNKGLHDVLPIWERVLSLRPGTTLTLMGGMSGEGALARTVAERNLPIVVFKPTNGFLPADEYYAKIKDARILFAPSHEEGWGIAVCEAMAAGLPVVAYDLPAYRTIYRGAYKAVPRYDFDAFARAIVAVLDSAEEYARLRTLGAACAARYDWDAIAQEDGHALDLRIRTARPATPSKPRANTRAADDASPG